MLNRIIKRGHRKGAKSDLLESAPYGYAGNPNVVVNHASRTGPAAGFTGNLQPQSVGGGGMAVTSIPPPSGVIEPLPLFREVSASERQNLFIRKLHICYFQFDFSDTLKSVREKEIKRQALMELVDYIQSGSGKITEVCQEEMIKMVSVNIFRCLPPYSHENTGTETLDPEEDEPNLEPSWIHLQLVYELLLRYVVSSETDTKVAKRYIDHSFVLKLLDMFDTEDPREREYLKTILHRIYGKFMVHRPFIRKGINNIFYRFIYETERHCGIGELLEILGSIINGFALPMKEEHKLFLIRALIPLHKPKSVTMYHQQLSYCIIQFVEKDYKLADTVIRGLLKYWPVTNCTKEVALLGELEEVLEATQAAEFQRCIGPLFRQIARCLNSAHFQVAERALFLWNNEHIVSLIAQNRNGILPIIFEALERNIKSHWNQAINGLTLNVRKMFLEMDVDLFEECQRQFEEKEANVKGVEEQRELTWKKLADVAAERSGEDMDSSHGDTLIYGRNHKDVLVVVDSEDYPALLEYLKRSQDDQQFRRNLAWKAFQHVASYDSAVSEWLWKQNNGDKFPPSFTVPLTLKSSLRYGENPHQEAAFYTDNSLSAFKPGGNESYIQHHGKERSYNNYLDTDAAWNCVTEFKHPTCVIVKHTNPCGVASRDDILEAYRLAVKADPVSAFGGIVAFNIEVDEVLAKEIREYRSPIDGETRMFYEIVVAPKYTKKGLEVLRKKSNTLRILEASKNEKGKISLRQAGGGWLAQRTDDLTPNDIEFNTVTERTPQESELRDAEFAWLCCKHVKSNAIVIAKDNCMLGMGSGQPNRVESLRISMKKVGEEVKGAALASDAFFPFAWNDAVEEACKSGIALIAEPGGSMRDSDAIDCCNKYGVSLVFTGVRHFQH